MIFGEHLYMPCQFSFIKKIIKLVLMYFLFSSLCRQSSMETLTDTQLLRIDLYLFLSPNT